MAFQITFILICYPLIIWSIITIGGIGPNSMFGSHFIFALQALLLLPVTIFSIFEIYQLHQQKLSLSTSWFFTVGMLLGFIFVALLSFRLDHWMAHLGFSFVFFLIFHGLKSYRLR